MTTKIIELLVKDEIALDSSLTETDVGSLQDTTESSTAISIIIRIDIYIYQSNKFIIRSIKNIMCSTQIS